MMMRNEDDDVKGGRDWWSEMPGADRFPPILHHLLSIGWDRDDHIGRDREYDKADDDHIGGHDQLMMTMIPEKLLQFWRKFLKIEKNGFEDLKVFKDY